MSYAVNSTGCINQFFKFDKAYQFPIGEALTVACMLDRYQPGVAGAL